jgi:hypothetical protein
VFHGFCRLPIAIGVFIGGALTDKLLACFRMLALAKPREILSGNRAGQSKLLRQSTLPLAGDLAALGPIILLFGREFLLVVALRLPSR